MKWLLKRCGSCVLVPQLSFGDGLFSGSALVFISSVIYLFIYLLLCQTQLVQDAIFICLQALDMKSAFYVSVALSSLCGLGLNSKDK